MRQAKDYETFFTHSDRINPDFVAECASYFEIGRQDALNNRPRKSPTRMPSWRTQYFAGYAAGQAIASVEVAA